MIRVNVDGVTATVTEKEILTAGRVGLECAFTFTGEWDGLFKTAVFQGVESVDVALPDNTCVVPWEAMQVEGVQLKVGVFGANGEGTIVIPTIWANAGKIQPSAVGSGTEPTEPSQNANAYAVETAEEAKNIALSVQQRADNGEFDGTDGTDGADGFSPSASVSKVGFVSTITITDKDGTTTATVLDGATGPRGADGVSPSALVSKVGNTATITITDENGTTTAIISDGATGPQGPAGPGVPTGGTTGQVLGKASDNDFDVVWKDAGSGSFDVTYGSTSLSAMRKAVTEGKRLTLTYNSRSYNVAYGTGGLSDGTIIFTSAADDGTIYWCKAEKASAITPTTTWTNGSVSGGGTTDYTDLTNKPSINSVTLSGNKTASDLGMIAAPSSPATGAFLVWDGSAWTAQTLSTWQGGSF